jgi:hypothetical protein
VGAIAHRKPCRPEVLVACSMRPIPKLGAFNAFLDAQLIDQTGWAIDSLALARTRSGSRSHPNSVSYQS